MKTNYVSVISLWLLLSSLITVSCLSCSKTISIDASLLQKEVIHISNYETSFRSSTKNTNGPVPVLVLKGTPYEQGLAYGVLMQNELTQVYTLYNKLIENNMDQLQGIQKYFKKFIRRSYVKKMKKITPPLCIEEMKGLSQGSGIPYETIAITCYGAYFFTGCTSVVSIPESAHGLRSVKSGVLIL
jgi:hypothetical protein